MPPIGNMVAAIPNMAFRMALKTDSNMFEMKVKMIATRAAPKQVPQMSAKTTKIVEDGPNVVVSFHDNPKRALVKGRDLGDSLWL